jgi:hypothetical protein
MHYDSGSHEGGFRAHTVALWGMGEQVHKGT